MNGVKFCSDFAGIVNKLRFCGPVDAYKNFDEQGRSLLEKFESLYPYLSFIAEKHSLDPFDYKVVEAYWVGNELCDGFSREEFSDFLPRLHKNGLPEKIMHHLQTSLPKTVYPCHAFHVLYVGVGNVTQSVPTTVQSMQQCLITSGRVVSVDDEFARIRGPMLDYEKAMCFKDVEREVRYTVKPAIDDIVAVHWGTIVCNISEKQESQLRMYTQKVIDVLNE